MATDFIPGGRVAKTALSFAGINPLEEGQVSKHTTPARPRGNMAAHRLEEALHG